MLLQNGNELTPAGRVHALSHLQDGRWSALQPPGSENGTQSMWILQQETLESEYRFKERMHEGTKGDRVVREVPM